MNKSHGIAFMLFLGLAVLIFTVFFLLGDNVFAPVETMAPSLVTVLPTESTVLQPQTLPPTLPVSEATELPSESNVSSSALPSLEVTEPVTEPPVTEQFSMPNSNGVMCFSADANNRFSYIVSHSYGISNSLLAAVFSLPDTGQNYVFEFNGSVGEDGRPLRNADTLRRVYLIDAQGAVTSIAAVNFAESANITQPENYVCIELMIKKLIMPKVQPFLDQIP